MDKEVLLIWYCLRCGRKDSTHAKKQNDLEDYSLIHTDKNKDIYLSTSDYCQECD